ncbi:MULTISPECIES: PD-(D/E)XK motif protein [unclassified Mycobacterium]|uniref:PD-(D/E)XK motif protein n=1 Tax=unclassified Mycobacterium TaxID=2642494 RepID=UPI0009EF4197|nr:MULTISPECIES: PD-(D/E)XK motif protein [unclassified Mycobacterium]
MGDELDDARHLTYSNLDTLWNAGAPLVLPVQGSPACELRIDPVSRCITLSTGYQTPEPDLTMLKNISFEAVTAGDEDLAEITVRVAGNVHGAYGLLATIADGLQIAKAPLAVAVSASVSRYKDVLAARTGLTAHEQVGLFGELLFLEFLICGSGGAGPAVSAWQGPLSEEHDFVFDEVNVEVKTTVSERRRHIIAGLSQLVPVRGTPLRLISIQITRAAGEAARTLPSLVAHVRNMAGGHVVPLDHRLEALGWRAEDADLYPTHWALRTRPRAYSIDGDFPAMTPERIAPAIPNFALVSDVTYTVDVTDLDYDSVPGALSGFVEDKET